MSNVVKKNQTAEIPTKNGNKYSYQYVDIAQIHEYLESIDAKYIQKVERIDGDDYIFTKRCFKDKWEDEWLQGSKIVDATLYGNDNPAQKQGSAITYARRYSLLMAFGLATEDDDANSLSKPKDDSKKDSKIESKIILATEKQCDVIKNKYADSVEILKDILKQLGKTRVVELTIKEASDIISGAYDEDSNGWQQEQE